MIDLSEEDILAIEDELAEKDWYEKQKEMNSSLLPCPKCGSKVEISFCEWMCCKAQARYIECFKCNLTADPDISDWNNRSSKLYDFCTGEEIV